MSKSQLSAKKFGIFLVISEVRSPDYRLQITEYAAYADYAEYAKYAESAKYAKYAKYHKSKCHSVQSPMSPFNLADPKIWSS